MIINSHKNQNFVGSKLKVETLTLFMELEKTFGVKIVDILPLPLSRIEYFDITFNLFSYDKFHKSCFGRIKSFL